MSDIGHNSKNVAGERLLSLVQRIERLNDEKKALQEDIKGVYDEAGSAGYDKRAIRQLVRLRAQDPQKLREQEEMLSIYKSAIGMD